MAKFGSGRVANAYDTFTGTSDRHSSLFERLFNVVERRVETAFRSYVYAWSETSPWLSRLLTLYSYGKGPLNSPVSIIKKDNNCFVTGYGSKHFDEMNYTPAAEFDWQILFDPEYAKLAVADRVPDYGRGVVTESTIERMIVENYVNRKVNEFASKLEEGEEITIKPTGWTLSDMTFDLAGEFVYDIANIAYRKIEDMVPFVEQPYILEQVAGSYDVVEATLGHKDLLGIKIGKD